MKLDRIENEELDGKGVTGLPTVPGLSTSEMQKKFDELPLEVLVPYFNRLVDRLNESFSNTVRDNTSEIPTSAAIVSYVTKMGGGDMMKSIYDNNGNGIVDNAERLGGELPSYYGTAEDVRSAVEIAKGKNQALIFDSTADMYSWIENSANKKKRNIGDNIYIRDVGVPDYWISSVLDTADEDGRYYKVSQLETQKVSTDASGINYDNSQSGISATNVQDAIDKLVASPSSNVRYNEETDSIEVLLDGEWVSTSLKANAKRYDLYVDGLNGGEFTAFAGGTTNYAPDSVKAPSIAFGNGMTISETTSNVNVGCAISKLIDLTKYKKIKLHHVSTNANANSIRLVNLFVTASKAGKMTTVALRTLHSNATRTDSDVEIDISALSGEYYIGIEAQAYQQETKTVITNMYME